VNIYQFLDIASQTGRLALAAVALAFFANKSARRATRIPLYGMLAYEALFGLLMGFKSSAVMPFVIVLLCNYFVNGRVSVKLIAVTCVGVASAYFFVERFRQAHDAGLVSDSRSVESLISTVFSPLQQSHDVGELYSETVDVFVVRIPTRLNLTGETARSIEFMKRSGLQEDSPAFLKDALLSPFYAFIPRFLWPSKPLMNDGLWYANEVLEMNTDRVNIDFGPVAYLYFGGGLILICIGFYLIGVTHHVIRYVFPLNGSGNALVYLGLLTPCAFIPGSVYSFFLSVLRFIVVLLVAQAFLFKR
jgi:hypothetical protein